MKLIITIAKFNEKMLLVKLNYNTKKKKKTTEPPISSSSTNNKKKMKEKCISELNLKEKEILKNIQLTKDNNYKKKNYQYIDNKNI